MKVQFQNPTQGPLITVSFDDDATVITQAYALVGASRVSVAATEGLATLRNAAQFAEVAPGMSGAGSTGGAGAIGIAGPLTLIGMLFAAGDSPTHPTQQGDLEDTSHTRSPSPTELRCMTDPYNTSAECAAVRCAMLLFPFTNLWPNDPNATRANATKAPPLAPLTPIDLPTAVTTVTTDSATSFSEQDLRQRLRDPDLQVQWKAWKDLYQLNPTAATAITPDDMGPPQPFAKGLRGVLRIINSIYDSNAKREVAEQLYNHHGENPWRRAKIDIRTIHPSHTLHEFSPIVTDPDGYNLDTRPYKWDYVQRLKGLLAQMGIRDSSNIKRLFVRESVRDEPDHAIYVLQLPSGKRVLWDGAHRTAAWVQVVREKKLDPEIWLSRFPVELFRVMDDFPIPEHLILRFLAPAHELTIEELLPAIIK